MKHSEVKFVELAVITFYAKEEVLKIHDEFLVVNLIFFSKSNAGIIILF